MKRFNFDFIPQSLRRWILPFTAIIAMLLLGYWFEFARFILFAHHLFWMIGGFLLLNAVIETFWPTSTNDKVKPALSQPSSKANRRTGARSQSARRKPAQTSETTTERLARLRQEKETVDKELEKVGGKGNRH